MFILLCRAEPSVLRAAAMGAVLLAALGGDPATGKGLRHLSLAVLGLVLIDPWLGRSAGFALSVLASGGIIVLARPWAARMSWAPPAVAESITVPLSAQLATQPVVTALSGEVSIVGLVANILTGPAVGPATVLGFAAAAVSQLWLPGAQFLGWLAGWCAQWILWVAHAGAALPGAAWRWPAGPAGLLVVTLLSVSAMAWAGAVLARRWLCLTLCLVVAVLPLRPTPTPGWPGEWAVIVCDVGQGDALLLRVAADAAVVVDTGPEPRAMAQCLGQAGVRHVPLLVLTHHHADHIGGLAAVWSQTSVATVLMPALDSPRSTADRVRREATAHGAAVAQARAGQQLTIGQVRWRTVGPVQIREGTARATPNGGENSAENDSSTVAVAEVARLRILLTGDVEPVGQREIVASGADLRADVLKMPHHGSARQESSFFAATGARAVVIGVGAQNRHGHPAANALRLATAQSMTIARTDQHGAIALSAGVREPHLVVQRTT